MNKNIEIQKIKANSFEELVSKAREYKNSGGEWKLLEHRVIIPVSPGENAKKGWSKKDKEIEIIISNGEQKIGLFIDNGLEINNFICEAQDKLKEIFPESNFWKMSESTGGSSGKMIKKGDKKLWLIRNFNAWSITDIFKLLVDYYLANKSQIDQSPDFDRWVKVKTHPGENYFTVLVGKNEDNWDWEIIIKRSDLERYITDGKDYKEGYDLNWKDLNNQQIVEELKEMRIEPFWLKLNRSRNKGTISLYNDYQIGFTNDKFEPMPRKKDDSIPKKKDNQLSLLGTKLLLNLDKISLDPIGRLANAEIIKGNEVEDMYKRGGGNDPIWTAWNDKVHQIEIGGQEINLTKLSWEDKLAIRKGIIAAIKSNPQDWKIENSSIYAQPSQNIPDSFKILKHKSGHRHWNVGILYLNESYEQGQKDWAEIEALLNGSVLPAKKPKNDWSEDQIEKYFRDNDIHSISLDGDKLVIEYNDKSKGKEITEAKNPQLQLIKHLVEQAENHSLTFSKPQQPINPSQSNPNNDKLVIGLAVGAGAVILVGIVVYFARKRKKK